LSTRPQNERKFDSWEELPNGGRRYWFEVAGRRGWKARYVKEIDADENTVRFWQEIYDDQGKLGGCTVNCVTGYSLRPTVGGSDDQEHSEARCPIG
jgi:hypothetical protein